MGADIHILAREYELVGFFKSKHIALLVGGDIFGRSETRPSFSNEIYAHKTLPLVFLNIRSGIFSGRNRLFAEELKTFVSNHKF